MKYIILIITLLSPIFTSAQLKLGGKGQVRHSDIHLPKAYFEDIQNSGEGDKNADFRKVKLPPQSEGDMSVTIVNPYNAKIRFAYSTSDIMRVVEMEPYSFWSGIANDYWQNFIIRTKDKNLTYSLKTNHCYTIFWDKGMKVWNVKPLKCGMYKD